MRQLATFTSFATIAVAAALSACGGGGGGGSQSVAPPPASLGTAEGLWGGSTSSGRSIRGLVLDDGNFWFFYTAAGNISVIAGVVEGSSTASDGNFSSANGVDFNLEGMGINTFLLSGTYTAKSKLGGTLTYSGKTDTFTSNYNAFDYGLTPSLATVAGTYSGTAATAGGIESATASISSSGAITGMGASGCSFTGTAAIHAKGNVYDVSVTFGGGVCSNGTSVVTGIAYYDANNHELSSAALDSGRTNGFLFVGQKP